jgi:hypothetical protein
MKRRKKRNRDQDSPTKTQPKAQYMIPLLNLTGPNPARAVTRLRLNDP